MVQTNTLSLTSHFTDFFISFIKVSFIIPFNFNHWLINHCLLSLNYILDFVLIFQLPSYIRELKNIQAILFQIEICLEKSI